MLNRAAMLTLLVALIAGCAITPPPQPAPGPVAKKMTCVLELRDKLGNSVASGDLTIPWPIPTGDGSFEGDWHLNSQSLPSSVERSGHYSAMLGAGLYSFNLSPEVADNNIMLSGLLENDTIHGKWMHATFTGGREMGPFIIEPQK